MACSEKQWQVQGDFIEVTRYKWMVGSEAKDVGCGRLKGALHTA